MFALDTTTVTHGIQLAVAPVFLLTAVAGMIGVVAGRLARIIDRARVVEEKGLASTDAAYLARARTELAQLRRRGRLANGGIALLTLCAVLIGTTIIVLFVGETTEFESGKLAVAGFLCGVVSFLLALVCFLVETVIATRVLNFYLPEKPRAPIAEQP
jgi:MFS family permease